MLNAIFSITLRKPRKMNKELLYRFFNQQTTIDEEKVIRSWIESSDENRKELFRERKAFDAFLLNAELALSSQTNRTYSLIRKIGIIVSSVAAIALIAIWGNTKYMEYLHEGMPENMITVPQGQRVNLVLADGTQVWLNSKTRMSYPQSFYMSDKRVVHIDGEAYFEVTKNKEKPFIVKTNHGEVKVLGTKFYLYSYSNKNEFETSLIEGQVSVSTPSSNLVLLPNEKAILKDNQLIRKKIDDLDVYRWRDGLYCFKELSLDEILSQFETYYDVKFIKKHSLQNKKINGKFRFADGIEYALKVLQKEVPFTFRRDENSNLIYIE